MLTRLTTGKNQAKQQFHSFVSGGRERFSGRGQESAKCCKVTTKMGTSSGSKTDVNVKKAKKGPSPTVRTYLIAYNLLQTLGWSYLLLQLIQHYAVSQQQSLYNSLKWTVIIFQNAAVLEIFHAATGMVPSNPVITAFQVASRVMVVCGVFIPTKDFDASFGLPLALLAWSVTEIIRYANYTLNLLNAVPYFLVWLRYSTFIILYPIGVTGELLCLYAAQNEVARTKLWTIEMPNSLNFIFNYRYFIIFVMLLYIPLFPQMYLHMFSQRRKVIGGEKTKKT